MHKKTLVLGIVALGGVLVISGCGKSLSDRAAEGLAEGMIEKSLGGNADVDLSGGSMKANVGGVSIETGDGAGLPTGFPSDVYVIKGKIISAINNIEQKSYSVYIETNGTVQEATLDYNKELADDGWTITGSANFGGVLSLSAEKEGRVLSVVISTGDEGKTLVMLSEYQK
jgi:hypothetical protein